MRCPSCTAENAASRRFCADCGKPLPSPCPGCGFENESTARFCGGCGKSVGETAASTPQVAPTPPRTDSAERRQLTIMFCDLVGSTELSSRLDPEDLREVIAAYHSAVAEIVAGLGGFVSRYMSDGVLIYFGYPQAHEDDPERAVRAGLRAVDAVRRLDVTSIRLQARVGIATGLVVVGDLIGAGSVQEQSVVGETPNVAARLQTLADPDAVVIAAGTRRLVGNLFEYRDLGAVEVKGIAGPVLVWQVLRPSVVASRFEALRGSARKDRHSVDRSRDGRARADARRQDAACQEIHIDNRTEARASTATRGRGRPPKAAANKLAGRKPSAPSLGKRVLALATGKTRQDLYLACPTDRPNHVGIAVQRHIRGGRIQERDGKLYATSRATEQSHTTALPD